ncbi:MAG: hypothetical protein HFG90_05710 [Acholeplasmatales bacterium]|jgi:hypothetical protein|nr:hypothetical protein [Acholeplasmatales bacterium]
MKKIFSLVCIGLGLLSLTSCKEQQQKIQYTDDTGKVQELVVQKTDNPEIVEGVFHFMEQAKYDDFTSFSTAFKLSTSMTNESKLTTSLDLGAQIGFHLEQGFMGEFYLNSNDKEVMRFDILYNGSLNLNQSLDYIYLTKKVDTSEEKFKVSANLILSEIIDAIEDVVPTLPDINQKPSFTIKDFYEKFSASKIEISQVTTKTIQIHIGLVLDDLLKQMLPQEEYMQMKQLLNIDFMQEFHFYLDVDPVTGLIQRFRVTFDNVKLINSLILLMKPNLPENVVIETLSKFKFSLDWTFSYQDVMIRQLTESEKDTYTELIGGLSLR